MIEKVMSEEQFNAKWQQVFKIDLDMNRIEQLAYMIQDYAKSAIDQNSSPERTAAAKALWSAADGIVTSVYEFITEAAEKEGA